jgi:hypothetical protein
VAVVVMWLDVLLGAICLAVGVVHLGLLATGRAPVVDAAAHTVMGVGMAAMFVPSLDIVPRPVWIVAFVLVAAWFGVDAVRAGSFLGGAGQHVVGAGAMLFMLLAGHDHGAAADPPHAHHLAAGGGGGLLVAAAALALAAWFVADVVRELTRGAHLAPATVGGSGASGFGGRGLVGTAQLAMAVAMAVMLLGMA